MLAGAHQAELDLILNVFNVHRAARGHATLERCRDLLCQLRDHLVDPAGRGGGATFNSEERFRYGHGNLAGLKGHNGSVAFNDTKLPWGSRVDLCAGLRGGGGGARRDICSGGDFCVLGGLHGHRVFTPL